MKTTNIHLRRLVSKLKKQEKPIWKRVALDLEKPRRIRREVNISKINRNSKKDDIIIIPGKVLGDGVIDKNLTVAAFQFSNSAKSKIEDAGGKAISINKLLKKSPDAKGVKILG